MLEREREKGIPMTPSCYHVPRTMIDATKGRRKT